jgi:hypothetical protein
MLISCILLVHVKCAIVCMLYCLCSLFSEGDGRYCGDGVQIEAMAPKDQRIRRQIDLSTSMLTSFLAFSSLFLNHLQKKNRDSLSPGMSGIRQQSDASFLSPSLLQQLNDIASFNPTATQLSPSQLYQSYVSPNSTHSHAQSSSSSPQSPFNHYPPNRNANSHYASSPTPLNSHFSPNKPPEHSRFRSESPQREHFDQYPESLQHYSSLCCLQSSPLIKVKIPKYRR